MHEIADVAAKTGTVGVGDDGNKIIELDDKVKIGNEYKG